MRLSRLLPPLAETSTITMFAIMAGLDATSSVGVGIAGATIVEIKKAVDNKKKPVNKTLN